MKPMSDRHEIERLARRLLAGELPLEEFVGRLSPSMSAQLGDATLDLDRARRCGYPEVVFAEGKSAATLLRICHTLHERGGEVFVTRVDPVQAERLSTEFPDGRHNAVARTFRVGGSRESAGRAAGPNANGRVAVITAGTSDLPVAEEARETAEWMGVEAIMIHDVGVAGPHRLPSRLPEIAGSDAVVVIAGMEGALPSVVAGHVDCPVIAVPTSVGYGAHLGGLAALLSMINSCAANVAVVNIDAGFKGAYVASLIAARAARGRAAKGESP